MIVVKINLIILAVFFVLWSLWGIANVVYTEILLVDATTASTRNNLVVITEHNEDLSDKEETFYIPKVSTSARDYYIQTYQHSEICICSL